MKKKLTKEQRLFEDYCDENGIDYEDLNQIQMEDLNNLFQAYVAGRRTALKELKDTLKSCGNIEYGSN